MHIVVSTFLTLDGYMVGPDEDVSWVIEHFDQEMAEDVALDMSRDSEAFLLGRVTYEIFAAYWPHAVPYDEGDALDPAGGKEDPRIIAALNDYPKYVFSTTLPEQAWQHTHLLRGGLEDEVRRLRAAPGRNVNVQGSASIVRALQQADLIDEYHLYVHPVLLGAGKPLFADSARQNLELTAHKRYANGVLSTHYARRP
jgi:dihydrofolate reductase